MAYRFRQAGRVPVEIQRIVEEQIDKAVAEIDGPDIKPAEAVHQVRKRCKKIRAVLRLARGPLGRSGVYASENACVRDIARDLSMLRDSEVLIETHDAVARSVTNPDLLIECAAVRGRLTTRRRALAEAQGSLDRALKAARRDLLESRERVAEWAGRVRRFRDLVPGLKKTYRRGRRAMKKAYRSGSDEAFHEWRKRAKYHWYACRLLRPSWPAAMDVRIRALSRLCDLLGDAHDLSVYRAVLETNPHWFGHKARLEEMLAVIHQRRDMLRSQARLPGARLFAEKPAALVERLGRYWQAREAADA